LQGAQAATTFSPGGLPALGPGDDVIEGQILAVSAILAAETVTQEDVEAGKGRISRRFDVGFQGDD
jgi:hypothetical protein